MKLFFALFLLCIGTAVADPDNQCSRLPGKMKQLEVVNGTAYGITIDNNFEQWNGCSWDLIHKKMKIAAIGKRGVWGIDENDELCKIVGRKLKRLNIKGLKGSKLRQVDTCDMGFVVVVSKSHSSYCFVESDKSYIVPRKIPGKFRHVSCGKSLWAVDLKNQVYVRQGVTRSNCTGSRWEKVEGLMLYVEASDDGPIFAIGLSGEKIYQRKGITRENRAGTSWQVIMKINAPIKLLSYDSDSNILWILTKEGAVIRCEISSC